MSRFFFVSGLAALLVLVGCDSSSNSPEEITCPIEPVSYSGDRKGSNSRTLLRVLVENTSDDDIKIKSGSITWEFQDVSYPRADEVQDYRVTTPIETVDQKLELGTERPESRGDIPDVVYPEDVTPQVDDIVHGVVATDFRENIRVVENNLTCEVR